MCLNYMFCHILSTTWNKFTTKKNTHYDWIFMKGANNSGVDLKWHEFWVFEYFGDSWSPEIFTQPQSTVSKVHRTVKESRTRREQQFCVETPRRWERSDENVQTSLSCRDGYSNSNKHSLRLWKHLQNTQHVEASRSRTRRGLLL